MSKPILCLSAALLLGGFLSTLAILAQDPGKSDGKPKAGQAFKPVAPLLVVMENVDDIFTDLKEKIAKKEFKAVKKDAQFLSELFNVATYHYEEKEKEWRQWSRQNLEQFQKLSGESDKKDGKALQATYDAINATCDACHQKYRDV